MTVEKNTLKDEIASQWRKSLLSSTAKVQEAIRNLDETGFQIVLVANEDNILIGTLTDGDIRRGLLRGLDLNSNIDEIAFKTPLVVPPQLGRETVIQIMQANKIHQLPVVDENRKIVGLHLYDELMLPKQRSNLMIIMAGGKGVRLRPHTENCPKPMLLVNDKPMLEHILERAKAAGIHNFIFAVHYLAHMIEDYFGDGSKWQVNIKYLHEGMPLGTAGGISLLESFPTEPFIVSNGDVLTDIHYDELLDFHLRNKAAATMAVRLHEWQHPFGVVKTKGLDIIGFEEKPISRSHINAGIYVLEPNVINFLKQDEICDMPTLFNRIRENEGRTIVYPMHEPWLDVGRASDLEKAREKNS